MRIFVFNFAFYFDSDVEGYDCDSYVVCDSHANIAQLEPRVITLLPCLERFSSDKAGLLSNENKLFKTCLI
jgi:hypothetical protein